MRQADLTECPFSPRFQYSLFLPKFEPAFPRRIFQVFRVEIRKKSKGLFLFFLKNGMILSGLAGENGVSKPARDNSGVKNAAIPAFSRRRGVFVALLKNCRMNRSAQCCEVV
ncbi:MAG TPA: hypothetical protein DEB39_07440 [Planctomycetaceae bacterium]|nr:hypothetical protein [Planctomycetaceae bacterium]